MFYVPFQAIITAVKKCYRSKSQRNIFIPDTFDPEWDHLFSEPGRILWSGLRRRFRTCHFGSGQTKRSKSPFHIFAPQTPGKKKVDLDADSAGGRGMYMMCDLLDKGNACQRQESVKTKNHSTQGEYIQKSKLQTSNSRHIRP